MQIVVVGLNQNSAPVAVRERLAFVPGDLPQGLDALRNHVNEGFILSTCNRVEVYGIVGHADSGAERLERFLADCRSFPPDELRGLAYTYGHEEAVAHLFRVAAGMDSMVVGECEVQAQLRAALEAAQAAGMLGPVMRRLGSAAVGAGKRVRARTAIGRSSISVVSLAMQAAARHGRPVRDASVVVIGAGDTADSVVRHIRSASPAAVTVASRRAERAAELAGRHGATAIGLEGLPAALTAADIVVGCTASPGVVVRPDDLVAAGPRRAPLLCIDLGVPRDFDPAVRDVAGVTLVDLDELQAEADANRARRLQELQQADRIVAGEVDRFMEWWRSRQVVPTIAALRAHAAAVRDAEVERALTRLGPLSEHDAFVVRAMAQRIVGKLLHEPLGVLRSDAEGANMAHVVRALFRLETGDEDQGCPSDEHPRRSASAREESSAS